MPIYDFTCPDCGDFTVMRKIAERDEPFACPECAGATERLIASAPFFSGMSGEQRSQHARNERSANEPRSTRSGHGMGCHCCATPKTSKNPNAMVSGGSGRPWMIGH